MKSNNEIAERNKKLGIVSLEDVEELYDELLSWDKKEFIEKHMYDSEVGIEENDEDTYNFDDVYEFVRDHDDDDLLDEIGEDSCFAFLRDRWSLSELMDAIKTGGRSWHRGYTDDEIILNTIDLKNTSEESQIQILKHLDRKVIENYLKYTANNNG